MKRRRPISRTIRPPTLPVLDDGGARVRLIAGEAWGRRSPVAVLSPLFYADVELARDGTIVLPDEHEDRAAYVLSGIVEAGGARFDPGRLLIFRPGDGIALRARDGGARVLLLGGAPLDGPRHLFWNFVSSSRERIEQASSDWAQGRFGKIPGTRRSSSRCRIAYGQKRWTEARPAAGNKPAAGVQRRLSPDSGPETRQARLAPSSVRRQLQCYDISLVDPRFRRGAAVGPAIARLPASPMNHVYDLGIVVNGVDHQAAARLP